MSSLESLIAVAGEAPLIDSLDFTLPPASTSVVDRRQAVRAYPTSASTLTPTGTRTVRIRLGGDDFVDASSIRLVYTINETKGSTGPLTPVSGPWGMWSQVYLRSNGVELDNISYYGRFHQQFGFNQLSMLEQFGEAGICGMSGSWNAAANPGNQPALGTIAANGSYTVMHKMHLSLFSSGKLLPTRYAPLELEMTLGAAADWLNTTGSRSSAYSISNIQLLYDSYILDESVQESFYKSLLASRVLSIPTMSVYQVVQNIPAGSTSFDFAAARAFSRLSHVWLTFRNAGARSSSFICPQTIDNNSGAAPLLSDDGPSARLSIGPKYFPDPQPVTTMTEHFYHFQKALPGVPNISRDNFQTNCFTICWDVRKVPSDPTSSLSTRSGDLLRIELKNLTADVATECYLTLFAFSVCAIRESGVTVLS